jgi:acyl carrier protein
MQVDAKFDEKVISLIAKAVSGKYRKVVISRETYLQKELGLDSIGMLALIFSFEEAFGIDIAQLGIDINTAKIKTVGDLLDVGHSIMSKRTISQES